MAPTSREPAGQLRLLAGGLILIAGLLVLATVAATQLWLSLLAGVLLLLLALAGGRRGIPRLLVMITLGFALVLLGAAVMQWRAGVATARTAPDIAPAPAPTLISGTVLESGRPLPGVPVQVSLWPSAGAAEVGDRIHTLNLPPVTTDEQGRYVVPLALEDVPRKYLMSRRTMNFEVATTDPRTAPLSTSARYLPGAAAWVDALGDKDSDPKTLDFDLGSMEATERSDGTTRRWPLFRLGLGPARG